jgi:DNA invertase Pin-like site-specific DNA recombinase
MSGGLNNNILVALSVLDINLTDRIMKYKASNSCKNYLKKYDKISSNAKTTKPRQQKLLSKTEISQIIQKYQQGATVYELADIYGCHRQTVSRHLKKNGVEMRSGRFECNKPYP